VDNKLGEITLVIPTYNRADALRTNLDSILGLKCVSEVIVVDDGSTDDTCEVCQDCADARLLVIGHPINKGVATARNTGVTAASGEWVLFGEDDCRFPPDYAEILRAEAALHKADIVGAPLLHIAGTDAETTRIAELHPRSHESSMDDVDIFPFAPIETPFVPARALVRRSIFDRISFFEGFPVNGYREETDFFVQAARSGYRVMLTPNTYCYQLRTWRGGQHHTSSARYEYWALRNNWTFLHRHGRWLAEQGYIPSASIAQADFIRKRCAMVVRGVLRERIARVRGRSSGR
jgi:glycosyltransferase involved in cell wall biosynthesis